MEIKKRILEFADTTEGAIIIGLLLIAAITGFRLFLGLVFSEWQI